MNLVLDTHVAFVRAAHKLKIRTKEPSTRMVLKSLELDLQKLESLYSRMESSRKYDSSVLVKLKLKIEELKKIVEEKKVSL